MVRTDTRKGGAAQFSRLETPPPPAEIPPPIFVTQLRKVRDFIEDQQRLATIKSDWLYRMCGHEGKRMLLVQHGFTPR